MHLEAIRSSAAAGDVRYGHRDHHGRSMKLGWWWHKYAACNNCK